MIYNPEAIERRLRTLLDQGASTGSALRKMYAEGHGKLLLVEPLSNALGVPVSEARRIVTAEIPVISDKRSSP